MVDDIRLNLENIEKTSRWQAKLLADALNMLHTTHQTFVLIRESLASLSGYEDTPEITAAWEAAVKNDHQILGILKRTVGEYMDPFNLPGGTQFGCEHQWVGVDQAPYCMKCGIDHPISGKRNVGADWEEVKKAANHLELVGVSGAHKGIKDIAQIMQSPIPTGSLTVGVDFLGATGVKLRPQEECRHNWEIQRDGSRCQLCGKLMPVHEQRKRMEQDGDI